MTVLSGSPCVVLAVVFYKPCCDTTWIKASSRSNDCRLCSVRKNIFNYHTNGLEWHSLSSGFAFASAKDLTFIFSHCSFCGLTFVIVIAFFLRVENYISINLTRDRLMLRRVRRTWNFKIDVLN